MNLKMTNNLKIILLATLISMIVFVGPSMAKNLMFFYVSHLNPARQILVGDRSLCEDLKTQIKFASAEKKTEILNSLLGVLKLSGGEFRMAVLDHDSQRKMLNFVTAEEIPSAGGALQSQSCLVGALQEFPSSMDVIIPALLESDLLLTNTDSQMQMAVQNLISQSCPNNTACIPPLKAYLIKTQDLRKNYTFANLLARTGPGGIIAIFEMLDTIPDEVLKDSSSGQKEYFIQVINITQFLDEVAKSKGQDEAVKRIDDPNYSSLKKELFRGFTPSRMAQLQNPYTTTNAIQTADVLKSGQELLLKYQQTLPKELSEFDNWNRNLASLGTRDLTPTEKQQMTALADGFFQWLLKNLGPSSNSLAQFQQTLTHSKIIQHPLASVYSELKNPAHKTVALKFLALAIPESKDAVAAFLQSYPTLPSQEKPQVLQQVLAKNPTEMAASGLPFQLFSMMTFEEAQQTIYPLNNYRDHLILGWKSLLAQKPELLKDEVSLAKLLLINRDDNILNNLILAIHTKASCSGPRLQIVPTLIDQDEKKMLEKLNLFKTHILCFKENPTGAEQLIQRMMYTSDNFRKQLLEALKKDPQFKGEFSERAQNILKRSPQDMPLVPFDQGDGDSEGV